MDKGGLALFLAIIVALAIGLFIGNGSGVSSMRHQAIERGYAEYDSKTAEWRWKNDLPETPKGD